MLADANIASPSESIPFPIRSEVYGRPELGCSSSESFGGCVGDDSNCAPMKAKSSDELMMHLRICYIG